MVNDVIYDGRWLYATQLSATNAERVLVEEPKPKPIPLRTVQMPPRSVGIKGRHCAPCVSLAPLERSAGTARLSGAR